MQDVIQAQRLRLGLTQDELAKEVGCTRSTIAHYENGHIQPSLDMAKKLANRFGISLDVLAADAPAATLKKHKRGRPKRAQCARAS